MAARAGVSLKTVTNVVHERPYVKQETRERVLAAIAELDYRPSRAGRQLQSGRSNLITRQQARQACPKNDQTNTWLRQDDTDNAHQETQQRRDVRNRQGERRDASTQEAHKGTSPETSVRSSHNSCNPRSIPHQNDYITRLVS